MHPCEFQNHDMFDGHQPTHGHVSKQYQQVHELLVSLFFLNVFFLEASSFVINNWLTQIVFSLVHGQAGY